MSPPDDSRVFLSPIETATGYEIPRHRVLRARVNDVRRGRDIPDWAFDRIYPEEVRRASERFWTPVRVARKATEMLAPNATTKVLDVGSGAGKFCLIGALTSPAQYTGVEQRGRLVSLARTLADEYDVRRATFIKGDMRSVDWGYFDALYFFNPFGENYFSNADRFDDSVELTPERFQRDVQFALAALDCMAWGTRVLTYHGLGRVLPREFECQRVETVGTDVLELWLKVGP